LRFNKVILIGEHLKKIASQILFQLQFIKFKSIRCCNYC